MHGRRVWLQVDESVAGADQLRDGDPASLADEFGHCPELFGGDVDELASVVHHPGEFT